MKVTLLNHSDTLGGASVVTFRLMQALQKAGIDAQLLVLTKSGDNKSVTQACARSARNYAFFMERINIFARNGFSKPNLFKVSTASHGVPLENHPLVSDADVIVLSWINQGMLSLDEIERIGQLGKPIVWIMHDMWNLTGICHHAHECDNFKDMCGNCQYIMGGYVRNDLSRFTWKRKQHLYNHSNIHFVAVSNWLAQKCRESSLLSDKPLSVIPNAFPIDFFFTHPTSPVKDYGIDYTKNIIIMGAARLDDPIKGIDYAVDALNILVDDYPQVAKDCVALFFGEIRNPEILTRIRLPHHHLGRISDPKYLRQLYASSKVVLSTSLYETLPGTLIEGQAAGCVPVSFGMGGQADIIDHKINGYIADYKSPASIAQGIAWAVDNAPSREQLHNSVRNRFAAEVVAQKYIDLFNDLLKG